MVWIVTNNKNSPDNSAAVDENTRAFYRALQSSPTISAIAAYMVPNPVKGEHFSERGLVVYAVAIGADGARTLDDLLAPGSRLRMIALPNTVPMRLKPLEREPVRFKVTRVQVRPGDHIAATSDGRILRVTGVRGRESAVFRIHGQLSNALYPFEIRRANVTSQWTALQGVGGRLGGETTLRLSPTAITNLQAAEGAGPAPIVLDVALPPLERPRGSWFQVLTAEHAILRGTIEVQLRDVELGFDQTFLTQAYDLLRVDPSADRREADLRARLPEIFYGHEQVTRAATVIPVELVVAFSPWPLIGLIASILALVALVAGAGVWMTRTVTFQSPALGQPVRLKPGEKIERETPRGRLTIVRPIFGAPHEIFSPTG